MLQQSQIFTRHFLLGFIETLWGREHEAEGLDSEAALLEAQLCFCFHSQWRHPVAPFCH